MAKWRDCVDLARKIAVYMSLPRFYFRGRRYGRVPNLRSFADLESRHIYSFQSYQAPRLKGQFGRPRWIVPTKSERARRAPLNFLERSLWQEKGWIRTASICPWKRERFNWSASLSFAGAGDWVGRSYLAPAFLGLRWIAGHLSGFSLGAFHVLLLGRMEKERRCKSLRISSLFWELFLELFLGITLFMMRNDYTILFPEFDHRGSRDNSSLQVLLYSVSRRLCS
jgi:hypothetical protein